MYGSLSLTCTIASRELSTSDSISPGERLKLKYPSLSIGVAIINNTVGLNEY